MLAIERLLFIQSVWISSRHGQLADSPLPTSRMLCSLKGGLLSAGGAVGEEGTCLYSHANKLSAGGLGTGLKLSFKKKKTGSISPSLCSKFYMFRKNFLNCIVSFPKKN